jgi:multicomponent Na+:H+ antiporter subunit F
MVVVVTIASALLVAGAVLAVVRIERGPSMLDRTIAFDVLTTTLVGAIAVESAWSRRTETIPILVVLSLVGFLGSVVIARFAAREPDDAGHVRPPADAVAEHEERAAADAVEREAAVDPEHHGGSAPGEVR